ncbi:MAG: DEAD/DEAH box helicase [Acetobacterium sp.]
MDTFHQLAPFIQDYIYRERWDNLRDIQVGACDVILNTDDNLLLSSGTASGKTEAAFLPVLTKLVESPSKSLGVLYISPLKALINDQFDRLEGLLEESRIPVTKWHGDASRSDKNKLLKNPEGVMQTTPESLEAMLMNRKTEAIKLFSDLKYIIIDEVHYFMSEDRGAQLICILERIQKLTDNVPIRIGLSATLGDYTLAEKWLNSGTNRNCQTPLFGSEKRSLRLSLQHFFVKYNSEKKEDKALMKNYYDYLYASTFGKKCILFSNSKAEVEESIANVKKIALKNKTDNVYLVHHGNISASFREYAEKKMKKSALPIVTGATLTLELGIDLGELERIVQTGCPLSVSSFVQRLGRTGRRGNPSEMWFVFREDTGKVYEEFYKAINWSFLMCIAMIQLYLEEKWIEPIPQKKLPYGILYHQTMSFMVSAGEISPGLLAQTMLSLSLFKEISQNDYKKLLKFLIQTEQLEMTENKGLLIGAKGEDEVNHFEFYTVFETPREYSVKFHSEEIGTVQEAFPIGERFALAGRTWETLDMDKEAGIIFVKEIKGISTNNWSSDGKYTVYTKITRKMKEILKSDTVYKYLGESAGERLADIRRVAENANITNEMVVKINDDMFGIFPFLGTKEFVTLSYALDSWGFSNQCYYDKGMPLCIFIKDHSKTAIEEILLKIKREPLDANQFTFPDEVQIKGKFNEFIPKELLKKQYIEDFLDVKSLKKELEGEKC